MNIASEASTLSIYAFEARKTMVCEGFDLCTNLDIDFRSAFIGVGAPKLNPFSNDVFKN